MWTEAALLALSTVVWNAQTGPGYEFNNRGNQAAARGDFRSAVQLHRQAIGVWRSLGRGYDAFVAASLSNLGDALCGEDNWPDAAAAFEQALVINRRVLGIHHIRTLANLNQLGNTYLALRDYRRAYTAFSEALPIEQAEFSRDAQLGHTLSGLAAVQSREGRPDQALPLAEQALTLCLNTDGPDSIITASMYANLAQIHYSAGRPARAIPLYRKSRAIYERAFGSNSPVLGSLYSAEGLAYLDDGDQGMAEQNLETAIRILTPSPEHRLMLAVADSNLGLLRMRQRRYPQADELFLKALALEEQCKPLPAGDMSITIDLLADLRDRQKRHADAAALRRRAAALRTPSPD